MEKILGKLGDGDVTVACWEPGQMEVPTTAIRMQPRFISASRAAAGCVRSIETVYVKPGAFVVHPPGEVHEYINGGRPARSSFGYAMARTCLSRHLEWRGNPRWTQSPGDAEYFRRHPPG